MTTFDASASALGFIHQIRWAMYELLITSRRESDQSLRITLEVFDDVALIDEFGRPLAATQLKQHSGRAPLTDKSPDLWKTIRVWLQTPSLAASDGPILSLITTSPLQPSNAVSLLGVDPASRDVAEVLRRFDEIASDGSKETKPGREAWKAADSSVRASLLRRMFIIGDQVHISDLNKLIHAELAPFVPSRHLAEYRDRLWGWWDSRSVGILLQNRKQVGASISAAELYERMQLIRDDFRTDSLSVDISLDFNDEEISAGYDEHFVEQLRLIKVGQGTLRSAVVDYLRAYAHTTKWVQDGDLFDDEIARYENALKDEWSRRFDEMLEDLESDGESDPTRRAIRGRELFRALGQSMQVTVRPDFTEAFHARGTRHRIANDGGYGWHPDFKELLGDVITEAIA